MFRKLELVMTSITTLKRRHLMATIYSWLVLIIETIVAKCHVP